MTVPAHGRAERRRYQLEVARLLDHIADQTRGQRRLAAAGATAGALVALERDVEDTRRRLAAVIRTRRPGDGGLPAGSAE